MGVRVKIEPERRAAGGRQLGWKPEREIGCRVPAHDQMRAAWCRDADQSITPAFGIEPEILKRACPPRGPD
jgi:hypothetical protein